MYYIDEDYYCGSDDNKEEDNSWKRFLPMERFNFEIEDDDEDDEAYDYNADDVAFEILSKKFTNVFMEKAYAITLSFYPQFRSQKVKLKEKLEERGESLCIDLDETKEGYLSGEIDDCWKGSKFDGIYFASNYRFVHNSASDLLLENYDAWFKHKISFENIYVESFYAGVYIKNIHNLLMNLQDEFFPELAFLPSDQMEEVKAYLAMEAESVFTILVLIDGDELNDSTVLSNLEDYEFEPLLLSPGPEIKRNAQGKVDFIKVERNGPNPEKIPDLCKHCKTYYDRNELNTLCVVNRFDQRNEKCFKCMAHIYVANRPAADLDDKGRLVIGSR
jgi:hypothetical protein